MHSLQLDFEDNISELRQDEKYIYIYLHLTMKIEVECKYFCFQ